jgi:hypothetical protein
MFRRSPSAKTPAPFPPIEKDNRCPRCGFNHEGWAFEPGYEKLCVKCGTPLAGPEEPDPYAQEKDGGAGFFGRLLGGLFGTKQGGVTEGVKQGEAPEAAHPDLATVGDDPGGRQPFPDPPGSFREEVESTGAAEQGGRPALEDVGEPVGQLDEPRAPEAAHIGACKREGRLLAAQGNYREAIELLRKVVALEPNDPEAWGELGRILYKGPGDLSASIECSRRALAIDEDLVWVKCNLCLALLFDGQFDLSKKGFLEVIRSVRNSRGCDEAFAENSKTLLHDCLGELYASKKEASGACLDHIRETIELLEIEKIYFH